MLHAIIAAIRHKHMHHGIRHRHMAFKVNTPCVHTVGGLPHDVFNIVTEYLVIMLPPPRFTSADLPMNVFDQGVVPPHLINYDEGATTYLYDHDYTNNHHLMHSVQNIEL